MENKANSSRFEAEIIDITEMVKQYADCADSQERELYFKIVNAIQALRD